MKIRWYTYRHFAEIGKLSIIDITDRYHEISWNFFVFLKSFCEHKIDCKQHIFLYTTLLKSCCIIWIYFILKHTYVWFLDCKYTFMTLACSFFLAIIYQYNVCRHRSLSSAIFHFFSLSSYGRQNGSLRFILHLVRRRF